MEKEDKKPQVTMVIDSSKNDYYFSPEQLRQILIKFRKDKNLSIEEFGRIADIDPDVLRDYEAGKFDLMLDAYRLMYRTYMFMREKHGKRDDELF